jgi:hypothetical protein
MAMGKRKRTRQPLGRHGGFSDGGESTVLHAIEINCCSEHRFQDSSRVNPHTPAGGYGRRTVRARPLDRATSLETAAERSHPPFIDDSTDEACDCLLVVSIRLQLSGIVETR